MSSLGNKILFPPTNTMLCFKQIPFIWLICFAVLHYCHGFKFSFFQNNRQVASIRRGPFRQQHFLASDQVSNADDPKKNSNNPSSFLSSPYFSSNLREALEGKRKHEHRFESVKRLEKLPIAELAKMLDRDLYKSQWFVTGKVEPKYFCRDFTYEDADVKIDSLEAYVDDVQALFDQKVSRADIISTEVNPELPNTITCTWRLSGRANYGPSGMYIKPFLVYTDFTINPENGLIQHQEDRYSIRLWELLLNAVFPNVSGSDGAAAEPPVPERIETPSDTIVLPVEAWVSRSKVQSYFGSAPLQDDQIAIGTHNGKAIRQERQKNSRRNDSSEDSYESNKHTKGEIRLNSYPNVAPDFERHEENESRMPRSAQANTASSSPQKYPEDKVINKQQQKNHNDLDDIEDTMMIQSASEQVSLFDIARQKSESKRQMEKLQALDPQLLQIAALEESLNSYLWQQQDGNVRPTVPSNETAFTLST